MNLLRANPAELATPATPAAQRGAAPSGGSPRRPLRVLLLAPSLDPTSGGIAGVGHSIAQLLADQADASAVVLRCFDLHATAGPAARPNPGEGEHTRAFGGSRWRFSCAALLEMATWADLVIFTHAGLASLLMPLPGRLRPKSIVFLHGIEVWRPLGFRRRKALEQADLLVANSQFTADRARQFTPGLPSIRVCHLGIADDPQSSAAAGAPSLSHDILIVGRMSSTERYKGHAELIAALPAVVESVPDARLIVAGTGDDQPRLAALARTAGVADRVVFTGFVSADQLAQLYRQAALLAMPSRGEGFGLVYLEAMQASIPCVASTADAAGEVVLDNQTGLLVDPGNGPQLAAGLCRLLTDSSLRARLGAAGRQRFLDHFTAQQFQQRFWSLVASMAPAGKFPHLAEAR